ncbi:peptidylprolyl isomerase [Flavobacterium sp. GT3R68]|uniref:peptidylprolyl isomerase n=1 Tax=Flavobacterium sp. GT3R68 TaxID=2594437 RepID=UPI000F865642|nr:peptidylprolyl isomerase [Flavobacterium sp. GT3R68]RTY92433.1 peptidylprolyl isomerase [Flavobacterium sp. GSN2]TRW94057.1 peptidylprolyl isomerase [Flavobacterium sp. GT3R68]
MAVLQKIRQRSLLLILVIGFCLLAFIVGDLFNKGGFSDMAKDVGSVNGKDIAFEDFRVKVSNAEKSGQGMTSTQAANRVWDQEISIALLTAEFEKLGIRVGEDHIIEVLKADQNIGQNPMFLNAAGKFDIAKFREYFKSNPEQAQMIKDREKDASLNAKFQIYNGLIKAAMFTTESEGKLKYEMEANKVNFDYVAVLFSSIKDSDVKISDSEITDFMKKNEKKYKAEESREIEYVLIEDKASVEDENEVKTNVNSLLAGRVEYNKATGKNDTLPGFRTATDNMEFVNANSDIPYDSTYVAKKDLPAEHAEQLFNLPQGEVYGPYMFGKYYCISKSLGRKAGANAKASHILISYEGTQVPNKKEKRTKEEAKAKAEMLLAQIQANPSSFMMLALTTSDDSSAQQGGDLGYFSQGQMVKPFNDFVFSNPIGKIGLVESDFGFHIINVTDKQDAIRLATIAQKIEPSDVTSDKIYNKAVQFEMDANEKDFAKVAKDAALTINPSVKVKVMDENFGAIGNQRQIVRWAFEKETNVGDVKRFEVANIGNVIAKLKKVYEVGLMPISEARVSIEPILKNKKKAEIIKAKMAGSSLDAIAKANGVAVQQVVDVTLENPSLPGVGPEQKVVGAAFGIGTNKTSGTIEGNSGVYVVKATTITKAPVLKSHEQYISKLKSQNASAAGRVIPALKADAEIEDNRAKFNY